MGEADYARLADLFRETVMDTLVRSMVSAGFLELPEGELSEDLVQRVWEVGFLVLSQFEEGGGFDVGHGPFWSHLAFTPRGKSIAEGPIISMASRNVLHGGLTFDGVRASIERVRKSRS